MLKLTALECALIEITQWVREANTTAQQTTRAAPPRFAGFAHLEVAAQPQEEVGLGFVAVPPQPDSGSDEENGFVVHQVHTWI